MKHLDPIVDQNNFDETIKNHLSNVIIIKRQTYSDLLQCLYASYLSPTVSTFTNVIKKNNFTSWPGLKVDLINKKLHKSVFTAQGHLSSQN